jgi:hypothetical protein
MAIGSHVSGEGRASHDAPLWGSEANASAAIVGVVSSPALLQQRVDLSGVRLSWYVSSTIITGAVPHAARHSTVESVKRPSGVVSPGLIPSAADR